MYLGSGGTQWGTSYSKRPLYAAKSETWTRPVIPTLACRQVQITDRICSGIAVLQSARRDEETTNYRLTGVAACDGAVAPCCGEV